MAGFVRQAVSVFLTKISVLLVSILSGVIISRSLGPEGRGYLALVLLIPSLATALGTLGLGPATVYFRSNRDSAQGELLTTLMVVGGIWGLVLFGLSWAARTFLAGPAVLAVGPADLLLCLATIPFTLMAHYSSHYLLASDKVGWYNLTSGLSTLIYFVLAWVLAFQHRLTVGSVIIVWSIAQIIGSVPTIVFTTANGRPFGRFSYRLAGDLLLYGLKSHAMVVLNYLNYRIDMFLMGKWSTTVEIGYYSLAVSLAELVWFAPSSIGTILFPRVSGDSGDEAKTLTAALGRFSIWFAGACSVGLLVVGRPLLAFLYSDAFAPAYGPLAALLPGVVSLSLFKILASDIAGRGRPLSVAAGTGVALLVNVAMNAILIPRFGAVGAGFSSSISYSVASLATLVAFCNLTGKPAREVLLLTAADVKSMTRRVLSLLQAKGKGGAR